MILFGSALPMPVVVVVIIAVVVEAKNNYFKKKKYSFSCGEGFLFVLLIVIFTKFNTVPGTCK